jgi:transcriptional regulator with XRE-family HTH domain
LSRVFMGFDKKIFSQRLCELRRAAALTQTQLGEKAGLKKSAVALLEAGRSNPSINVFCDLGQALGSSLDYLAGADKAAPLPLWLKSHLEALAGLDPVSRKSVIAVIEALAGGIRTPPKGGN